MSTSLFVFLTSAVVFATPAVSFCITNGNSNPLHPLQRHALPQQSRVSASRLGRSPLRMIPKSVADRNSQAIKAIKASIKSPKDPSFPLLECEFPPLASQNKLGDGSLRSAKQAQQANLSFTIQLLQSLSSPIPFLPSKTTTWLLTSSAASNSMLNDIASKLKRSSVKIHSLKDGLPDVNTGDSCVLLTPSTKGDYLAADKLARLGDACAVVIVNGFAKDNKSVSNSATMSYFLKPLTYNSQTAGYLIRIYPKKWVTVDAFSGKVLESAGDEEILVRKTNTPDLRRSGKLVQKSVDERAILARKNGGK